MQQQPSPTTPASEPPTISPSIHNYRRFFPTPPLNSIRKYTNNEYAHIIHTISESCWLHYKCDKPSKRHGGTLYTGQLGPCSYLRLRIVQTFSKTSSSSSTTTSQLTLPRDWSFESLTKLALESADEGISHATTKSRSPNRLTLLEGPLIGALALKAVILKQSDEIYASGAAAQQLLLTLSRSVKALSKRECEVLYGRAGMLQAILFLRKGLDDPHVGAELAGPLLESVLFEGLDTAADQRHRDRALPLLWEWHESYYIGAAHGVVGILHTLLHFLPEITELERKNDVNYVSVIRATIERLDDWCMPSGNLTPRLEKERDELVQWCHGAPGHVLLLVKAFEVFDEMKYLERAETLARGVVFSRGLLKKGVGLCHGISGNAYVFLALHRARTGRNGSGYNGEWLDMARHFADVALNKYHSLERVPDRPYSLFEGTSGLVALLLDLLNPDEARFPCYDY